MRIQGGIIAANGITSIFMVSSVLAVPTVGKVKREDPRDSHSGSKEKDSKGLFAQVLEEAVHEPEPAPRDCCTMLYGRDSRLQTFRYMTREYHY